MALFYEPFYDLDRLLDDTFRAPTSTDVARRSKEDSNQVSRPMKPRYAAPILMTFFI